MTVYIGPPGNLQALPSLDRGMTAPLDLGAAVQKSLAGVTTVDYMGAPRRTYALSRKYLTQDELAIVEGLALGAYGDPTTLVMLDPFRRNLLTENQSTAGDYARDTSGFTANVGSVALGGPLTTAPQGRYYETYTSPAAGAAGSAGLIVGAQSSAAVVTTPGNAVPGRPGVIYSFQASLLSVSGTAAAWRPTIIFYDVAGANIGVTNGSAVTVSGAWQSVSVTTAASPAGTAYVVPAITNNATLAAVNTVGVDRLILSEGATLPAWVIGTGVSRVAFVGSLDLSYPDIVGANNLSWTLQEIG